MKEEKKYTEEFKKSAVTRLENGESFSHLSKELSVNKKILENWLSRFKDNRLKKLKNCHKKYTAYKAHIEKKKGTPYDSKIGGIPYVSDGDKWIICTKCNREKVLILQLNINELPDVSSALREWDFVQVFACMRPSEVLLEDEEGYTDYKTAQYKGEKNKDGYLGEFFYKRIEANRCYNMIERDSHYDTCFDEEVDGKNMNPQDPFNLYFDIQLVKKDKKARSFVYPPWIDGYNLFVNTQDKKIESNIYNDQRSYVWAEQHCFEETIIIEWEKLRDVECERHFKNLNICSVSENSNSDLLGLLNSYWIEEQGLEVMAYFKLSELQEKLKKEEATMEKIEEWREKEKKVQQIMNCPCCDKPLTLLFQFSLSEENKLILKAERDSWNNNVYALFYCENEPEIMSCQWVGYED